MQDERERGQRPETVFRENNAFDVHSMRYDAARVLADIWCIEVKERAQMRAIRLPVNEWKKAWR